MSNVSGEGSDRAAIPTMNKIQTGSDEVPLQRSVDGRRGIMLAIRWSTQFPNSKLIRGLLSTRRAKRYIPVEAVCLPKGILDIQSPGFPFANSAQGDNRQVK